MFLMPPTIKKHRFNTNWRQIHYIVHTNALVMHPVY